MGLKSRTEADTESCLREALLFATVCIVGLPVDVHVRDGSVYSGTFHTASVGNDYGVVLKEAKLTRKGKCEANVGNGSVIDTLVILSDDLVEVVAKGVLFPADGFTGNISGDGMEAVVASEPAKGVYHEEITANELMLDKKNLNKSSRGSAKANNCRAFGFMPIKSAKEHEEKEMKLDYSGNSMEVEQEKRQRPNISRHEETSGDSTNGRQTGDEGSQFNQDHSKEKFEFQREKTTHEDQSPKSINSGPIEAKYDEKGQIIMNLFCNGLPADPAHALNILNNGERPASVSTISTSPVCSSASTVPNSVLDVSLESHSGSSTSSRVVSPQSTESNKSSKEFKLNPGAKIFSPSFLNPISATPPALPTVASMAYIPSNPTVTPLAAAQQEVGINPFAPRPSVTSKFSPFNNLTAGNGGSGSQFSQPTVGHMGSRMQTLRYTGQYPAVQAGQTYVPQNTPPVMVGRLGQQLVYVQPVHDLVANAAAISPVSMRPLLTQQVQYPKHQAGQALQLCMPQPFVAGGQQSFALTSHIPVLQHPVPANRPIGVSGSTTTFSTKFP
ncbi:hypothetical protein K2173_010700 [Erythroxylum novogranatense]|uniref:Ataxin 2 SM domain-containing protein n=1 Tax=Erythroxylum novogranatense TaxID=1862640 RepID=A0AAV8SRH4_9ROSI|nr:hypothetical protein K2173_010700 [Erythroxylum novogranatense]